MAPPKPEVNRSQIIRDFVSKNPALTITEVVTKLGEEGVTVTKNLVYMVKMKMKAKKLKEKKAKAAAKESSGKAGSNGSTKAPSKSALVRDFLKQNRKMTAKDVVSALAEKGVTVTEGLVYFVKGNMKGKRSQKKKAQKAAAAQVVMSTPAAANGDVLKTILKVKTFAAEVGGMKNLIALAQALSQ